KIQDKYKFLPPNSDVRLRYTDFTSGADAYTSEAWAVAGEYNSTEEAWLPRVMVRHKADKPIETTFVSIIEPYDGQSGPLMKSSRRLPIKNAADSSVALAIELSDGRSDNLVINDSDA